MVWTQLYSSDSPVTANLTWELLHFQPEDNPTCLPYEGLLLRRHSATPPPLVVFPHRGPHLSNSADFLTWPVCLAALGNAVLMGLETPLDPSLWMGVAVNHI